jgi:hypothetical protein
MTSELPRNPSETPGGYLRAFPLPVLGLRAVFRKGALLAAAAMVVGTIELTVSACSVDRESAQAQGASASIGVQMTELFVTIENKAGTPLINVTVSIVSVGGLPFTRLVSRMENGERRDMSLAEFSGRDGTTFSLRVVRPKSVRVTAEDLAGKKHEAEVPWK